MSDELFRIAIVVGVGLAGVAFIVQAAVAVALFRRIGKMQDKAAPVLEGAKPVLEKAGPMVDKVAALLDKAVPTIEKAGPAIQQAGAAADRLKAVAERAEKVLASANQVIDDARPRVVELSAQMVEIAKTGREHVDRLGTLLNDASEKAHDRLTQIDHSVENTIEQVEQVSDAMRRAVMKPVREVNGVAAAISAVISTLVKRSHKSSVDTAVQDEEMFI